MTFTVTLTHEEMEQCAAFARETLRRVFARNAHQTVAFNHSNESRVRVEIAGRAGEMAYAKHYSLPLRNDQNIGGADFVHAGKTVDVKTTPLANARNLFVAPGQLQRNPCDLYVMATACELPSVVFVGFATHNEVAEREPKSFGHEPAHAIPFPDLHSFDATGKHNKQACRACGPTLTPDQRAWVAEYEAVEARLWK